MHKDFDATDIKILKMIIHMGAQDGVARVSSKKIAKECDIATGTIFLRFGTMRNALDMAAQYFDTTHMSRLSVMASENKTLSELWDFFMDSLMEDPDGSLYYTSYTNTFGFDPTINNPRAEEFLVIVKSFFKSGKDISDEKYLLLWDYITTMAFYYSEKFIHYMPYNEENKAYVKELVFSGLRNII